MRNVRRVDAHRMSQAIRDAKSAIGREDYPAAIGLLRPLAESGIAEAQCLLGSLQLTAEAITQEEARAWFQQAAKQNYPAAFYHLFVIGPDQVMKRIEEDQPRRDLLVRAAELGWADAQDHLGRLYATGDCGFPLDHSLARLWYGRAAEQGDTDAQYQFAFMVLLGEGGPADRETAYGWFLKAAKGGQQEAQRFLAENPYEKAEPSGAPNAGSAGAPPASVT